jgi:hypothetical protein
MLLLRRVERIERFGHTGIAFSLATTVFKQSMDIMSSLAYNNHYFGTQLDGVHTPL